MIMKDLTATGTGTGTGTGITKEMGLQMAVKAVNNTAGDNNLVPTLLVFGAYSRMQKLDSPSSTITQRAEAIKKAIKKVRIARAQRQVSDTLNIRNGSITNHLHNLSLNSEVLV